MGVTFPYIMFSIVINAGIPGSWYINGGLVDSNVNSYTLTGNYDTQYVLLFVPDDNSIAQYTTVFNLPDSVQFEHEDGNVINLVLQPIGSLSPVAAFWFYRETCTNTFTFYYTGNGPVSSLEWGFGDVCCGHGTVVSHTYLWYFDFDVTLTARLRQFPIGEPCCGGGPPDIIDTDTQRVRSRRRVPECSIEIDPSVQCCGESARNCIVLNETVTFRSNVIPHNEDCETIQVPEPPLYYTWRIIDLEDNSVVFEQAGENLEEIQYTFTEEKKSYRVELEVCNCCGCCSCSVDVNTSPEVFVERISCLLFRLRDRLNYPTPVKLTVTLFNTKEEEVVLYTQENYLNGQSFDIGLPMDGIYILEYKTEVITTDENNITSTTVVERYRFVLYDFCRILQCYKRLLMLIDCSNCEKCDKGEFMKAFHQINLFVMNASAFLYNIFVHYGLTYGHFYFEQQYITLLRDTEFYIEQLLRICNLCGCMENQNPINCCGSTVPLIPIP